MKDSEKLIKKIYERINSADWGDIDPYWFAYIDLKKSTKDYSEDHVSFQKLLQEALK